MTRRDASRRRRVLPAVVVAAVVTALLVVPQLLPLGGVSAPPPVFPRTVAAYSWWTTPLGAGDIDRATVVYQNGVGVEFLDTPQSVVLGEDGSTYRRLSVAEERSTVMDQGDPARTVLGPDGSFAVVGSGTRVGEITLVSFGDGATRHLPIGEGRVAVPQSITADGRTVLLLVGDPPMSRYTDLNFRLRGELITLDLATGAVTEHPAATAVDAGAISPDGGLVLFGVDDGLRLLDVASGEVRDVDSLGRGTVVDGGAFSPSARRIASSAGAALQIADVDAAGDMRTWLLPGFEVAYPLGWRDDDTVLVQGITDSDANTSALAWVDARTGEVEVFSTYAPDFTGAAMWVSSAAAGLVSEWTIADTRNDRGYLPIVIALAVGMAAGVVAWLLTPRRRARVEADAAPHPLDDAEARADERVSV